MQKKHKEVIKHQIKSMHQKKSINFRFIVLICFSFLIQNLAFSTLQKTVGYTKLSSSTTQNKYFENGTNNDQESQLNLFVEAESEDEDDIHDEQAVCNGSLSSHQNFKAEYFTGIINTLYLRLAFSNLHKVDIPFFIRYHSWKSQLA